MQEELSEQLRCNKQYPAQGLYLASNMSMDTYSTDCPRLPESDPGS